MVGTRAEFVYDPEHTQFQQHAGGTSRLSRRGDRLPVACAGAVRASANGRFHALLESSEEQHFRWTLVSYDEVRETAESLLSDMVAHYQEALPTEAPLARGRPH